jgi:hypothetical protein
VHAFTPVIECCGHRTRDDGAAGPCRWAIAA